MTTGHRAPIITTEKASDDFKRHLRYQSTRISAYASTFSDLEKLPDLSEITRNTGYNCSKYGAVWCLSDHLRAAGENSHLRGARPPFWWYAIRAPPTHRQRSTSHIRKLLHDNNHWDVAVEFVKGDLFHWGSGLIKKELDRRHEAIKFTEPGMWPILAHGPLSYFDDGRPLSAGAVSYFLCLARIWL